MIQTLIFGTPVCLGFATINPSVEYECIRQSDNSYTPLFKTQNITQTFRVVLKEVFRHHCYSYYLITSWLGHIAPSIS